MLKNLKKLFVCFLVLLFSSVSIVNISTVASFFDYPSDGDDYDYEDSSGEPLELDIFFFDPSDYPYFDILCTKIKEILREKKLYDKETKRDLKDIFSLLCENDNDLSCKISRILEKRSQRDFYNLYQKFMSKLRIRAKDKKNVRRVDALLLLSYIYLFETNQLSEEMPIFNDREKQDLKINLKIIFSGTVYESILEIFHS